MGAIERVCAEGRHLPADIGGKARTTETTDAAIAALG
jgi:isocitrate/isopropylmalate dehydrogenase